MTSGIYVFAAALDASMVELSGLCERAILDVWGECSYYTMAETGSATWLCLKSDAPALLAPAPTRKLKLDQVLIDATSERFAYLPTKPRPALNALSVCRTFAIIARARLARTSLGLRGRT